MIIISISLSIDFMQLWMTCSLLKLTIITEISFLLISMIYTHSTILTIYCNIKSNYAKNYSHGGIGFYR